MEGSQLSLPRSWHRDHVRPFTLRAVARRRWPERVEAAQAARRAEHVHLVRLADRQFHPGAAVGLRVGMPAPKAVAMPATQADRHGTGERLVALQLGIEPRVP